MPRGPKGEKRPADVIGNAIHVMRAQASMPLGLFSYPIWPDPAPSENRTTRRPAARQRNGPSSRVQAEAVIHRMPRGGNGASGWS